MKQEDREKLLWATVIILGVIIIILLFWGNKLPFSSGSGGGSSLSISSSNPTGQVSGQCSNGQDYKCTTICTNNPAPTTPTCPPTTPPTSNPCRAGETLCPDGVCRTSCTPTVPTTPSIPTDGMTCRNYATSRGYSGSQFQIDITSITSCQYWVYTNKCTAPTKVDIAGNCCMWTC